MSQFLWRQQFFSWLGQKPRWTPVQQGKSSSYEPDRKFPQNDTEKLELEAECDSSYFQTSTLAKEHGNNAAGVIFKKRKMTFRGIFIFSQLNKLEDLIDWSSPVHQTWEENLHLLWGSLLFLSLWCWKTDGRRWEDVFLSLWGLFMHNVIAQPFNLSPTITTNLPDPDLNPILTSTKPLNLHSGLWSSEDEPKGPHIKKMSSLSKIDFLVTYYSLCSKYKNTHTLSLSFSLFRALSVNLYWRHKQHLWFFWLSDVSRLTIRLTSDSSFHLSFWALSICRFFSHLSGCSPVFLGLFWFLPLQINTD